MSGSQANSLIRKQREGSEELSILWEEFQDLAIQHKKLQNVTRGADELEGVAELKRAIITEKEVRRLSRRFDRVEPDNNKLQERVEVLEKENKRLLEEIEALKKENNLLLERIEVLEDDNFSLLSRLAAVETHNRSLQKDLTTLQTFAKYGNYCTTLFSHAAKDAKLRPVEFRRELDKEIFSGVADHWVKPCHVKLDTYLKTLKISRSEWDLSNFFAIGQNVALHGDVDSYSAITRDLKGVNLLPGTDRATKDMLKAVIRAYRRVKMWR